MLLCLFFIHVRKTWFWMVARSVRKYFKETTLISVSAIRYQQQRSSPGDLYLEKISRSKPMHHDSIIRYPIPLSSQFSQNLSLRWKTSKNCMAWNILLVTLPLITIIFEENEWCNMFRWMEEISIFSKRRFPHNYMRKWLKQGTRFNTCNYDKCVQNCLPCCFWSVSEESILTFADYSKKIL